MDEGWRISYTDGTDRNEGATAAAVSMDFRGRANTLHTLWLGNVASIGDA